MSRLVTSTEAQLASLGLNGVVIIQDTGAHTGLDVCCIVAVGTVNVTFTTLTSGKLSDGTTDVVTAPGGSLAATVLAPGQMLFGRFTAITLATGDVWCAVTKKVA